MKIIHILEDFSLQSGGIRTVVGDLHKRLLNNEVKSVVVTPSSEVNDDVIKVSGANKIWKFSKSLKNKLEELLISNETIIHIHGVWMYPQYLAAKFAIKNGIPFIISCHGMYEPWLWTKGTLKKQLYFKLLSKPVFLKANYIHTITKNEATEIKKLLPNVPTIEIPNLIDVETDSNHKTFPKDKYILYLGRLDEKKGIDLLIRAFSKIELKDFKLKIAGEFNLYKKELETLVIDLNLINKVDFLGLVVGKVKTDLFKNAFLFAAPSHSEVIGMVNLEAAIQKTPVITTFQTGLDIGWINNGGFLINPKEEELTQALETATKWSLKEREDNGKMLYDFVLKNYSWKNRFNDWVTLYESML